MTNSDSKSVRNSFPSRQNHDSNGGGLYIHIPYCRKKCLYCDFFSGGAGIADWQRLRKALVAELRERRDEIPRPLQTLYIGGGTPSLFPTDEFRGFCRDLQETLNESGALDGELADLDEFTIEVNPEDVDEKVAEVWKECGVSRVSMGVQSFSDSELQFIGRGHTAAEALAAATILRKKFSNLSLDLIFGLPGQDMASLKHSLDTILGIHPDHLSLYSLMYEEGTALTARLRRGDFSQTGEEESLAMYMMIRDTLSESGYTQYEISNYSLPGMHSRHNRSYWTGKAYLGIGPSACSYDGYRTRRSNPLSLKGYLERFAPSEEFSERNRNGISDKDSRRGEVPFFKEEILGDEELVEERVMLEMRMAEGVDLVAFRKDFGDEAWRRLMSNAKKIPGNTITIGEGFIRLTPEGVMLSDDIILRLLQ